MQKSSFSGRVGESIGSRFGIRVPIALVVKFVHPKLFSIVRLSKTNKTSSGSPRVSSFSESLFS